MTDPSKPEQPSIRGPRMTTELTPDLVQSAMAQITDFAHDAEDAEAFGHCSGFCRACASIYVAVCEAADSVTRDLNILAKRPLIESVNDD